jgi:hypothetical protein
MGWISFWGKARDEPSTFSKASLIGVPWFALRGDAAQPRVPCKDRRFLVEGWHPMQVTVFCFDWKEVEKRGSSRQIVEEMIETDDIDLYAIGLPEGLWSSDSAMQHFSTAEILAEAVKARPHDEKLREMASLIAAGESVDELGLWPLTEGCCFVSISPARVASLLRAFQGSDLESIPGIDLDAKEWIGQWRSALEFANAKGLGVIGRCG